CAPLLDELGDRRAMALRDRVERARVRRIRAFRAAGAVDQLVGDALERGDNRDDRLTLPRLDQDAADAANPRRRGQRRAAEFENSDELWASDTCSAAAFALRHDSGER